MGGHSLCQGGSQRHQRFHLPARAVRHVQKGLKDGVGFTPAQRWGWPTMGSGGRRAAALPPWRLLLLFSPGFVAVVAAEDRPQATGPSSHVECLNSYGSGSCRVACVWHPPCCPGDARFYLHFSHLHYDDTQGQLLCPLLASPEAQDTYACAAECEEGEFTGSDQYRVSLHAAFPGKTLIYPVFAAYEPRMHIACDPPVDLLSTMSRGKCRLEWEKPRAYENIFLGAWQWELAFKPTQAPWQQAQIRVWVHKEAWLEIEGSELRPGTNYTARLRGKTPDQDQSYRSLWSPWSALTTWETPPEEADGQPKPLGSGPPRTLLWAVPFCLGGFLLALQLFRRARANAKIPTPAAFFQPLYNVHNGDFKDWVGLTEKGAWLVGGSSNVKTHEPLARVCGKGAEEEEAGALVPPLVAFLKPLAAEVKAVTLRRCLSPLQEEPPACCQYVSATEAAPLWVQEDSQPGRGCRPDPPPPGRSRGSRTEWTFSFATEQGGATASTGETKALCCNSSSVWVVPAIPGQPQGTVLQKPRSLSRNPCQAGHGLPSIP